MNIEIDKYVVQWAYIIYFQKLNMELKDNTIYGKDDNGYEFFAMRPMEPDHKGKGAWGY
jgi:hypothetical protein